MAERTISEMRDRLAVLAPLELRIDDESALHVGHAGAASGGGHYREWRAIGLCMMRLPISCSARSTRSR